MYSDEIVSGYEMTFPSYCCQKCGELIGWLGRIMPFHKCKGKQHFGVEE